MSESPADAVELPVLLYHGRPMTPEPINGTLHTMRRDLAAGRAVYAILEPGDATRYELVVLAMAHYGYFVARVEHGADQVRGVYLAGHYRIDELRPLGANPWTMLVLDWWVRLALGLSPRDDASEDGDDDE